MPRSPARLHGLLALLLLAATVLVGGLVVPSSTAATESARTWVVDAVDDTASNRWESVDTGTSVVTVAVGDTVEWQFDRATQGHDLTSLAPSQPHDSVWTPSLAAYRDAGGAPVRYTFTEPGTYRYLCSMHGSLMSGTVVVTDVEGNQPPTAAPVVTPISGDAPLVVHATANATDPDDDVVAVSWDFGTGGAATHTDHAMAEYVTPGEYVVRLRVSDGRGGLLVEEFAITVTGEAGPPDPEPPVDDSALPAIDALAGPGASPLDVRFSTQVTTTGALGAYSVGLVDHPDLTGEAVLVRRRGQTWTSLRVTGAQPSTAHANVHVHAKACDDELGGPHFRFDTSQPFAEANEIWPLFTTDPTGASGLVEVTKPMRADSAAVSVVVHDPANASRRIGCADLSPGTADLAYAWSFGDGTTGTGADPDHTYAAAGTYAATVTVAHGSVAHAEHVSVTDTVQVVVGAGAPPLVVPPVLLPPVDRTGPRISSVRPSRSTTSRRPSVRARVSDASGVRARSIVLRLDGRRVSGVRHDTARELVRWKPRMRLAPGRHVVRLVARDVAGNRTTRTWRFTISLARRGASGASEPPSSSRLR